MALCERIVTEVRKSLGERGGRCLAGLMYLLLRSSQCIGIKSENTEKKEKVRWGVLERRSKQKIEIRSNDQMARNDIILDVLVVSVGSNEILMKYTIKHGQ